MADEPTFAHLELDSEYKFLPPHGKFNCHATNKMKADFKKNGFVIIRNLFDANETWKLKESVENSDFLRTSFTLSDSQGYRYRQNQWTEVGEDILGCSVRTDKVVQVAQELLNRGEIYLYSGKVILKAAKTGGSVHWHQDYGYFYMNQCLFPDFATCFIALTKNDRDNGGLQVLKGSHLCGRIDHLKSAGQQGADKQRVASLEKILEKKYFDLKAGDAAFFHGNLLHMSEANLSEHKRYGLIYTFNAKSNSPAVPSAGAAQYSVPIDKMHWNAVQECKNLALHQRDYMDPTQDKHIDVQAES